MQVYVRQDIEAAFEFLGLFLSFRTPYTSLATLISSATPLAHLIPQRKWTQVLHIFSWLGSALT